MSGGSGGSPGGVNGNAGTSETFGSTEYTLYHLGRGTGSGVYAVTVDDESVYWAQHGGRLMKASKDGLGNPGVLGSWGSTLAGMIIRAGRDYVYWLDGGYLSRVHKSGGETERISLPWPAGEGLAIDETYVYVAAAGCAAVVRVHQDTLAQESLSVETPLVARTGRTYLARAGDTLYCGAWQRLYAIRAWSRLEELTTAANEVAGIALLGDTLYWLDKKSNPDGTPTGEMWTLSPNGNAEKAADSHVSTVAPYDIFPDDERARLVWVNNNAVEYSIESRMTKALTQGSFGTGCARDETYL
jgi:hypothetical protein